MEVDTVILLLHCSRLDDHSSRGVVTNEEIPEAVLIPRLIRVELELELTIVICPLGPVEGVEIIRNLNPRIVVVEEREEQLHQIPL